MIGREARLIAATRPQPWAGQRSAETIGRISATLLFGRLSNEPPATTLSRIQEHIEKMENAQ